MDAVVAGCLSGMATRFLTSPFDVLKVRMQLQIEPISKQADSGVKYRGLYHATRTILKEEGGRAFWKGFLAGQILYIIYGGTQFSMYEFSRKSLLKFSGDLTTSGKTAVNFLSGCVAGATATFVSFPFDILRTRMISQGNDKVYFGLYRGLVMMYSENGLRTFFKGLTPSLLSVAPQAGLQFSFFKLSCSAWDSWSSPAKGNGGEHDREGVKWAVCGGMAGITSKFIVLPFDLIKKRMEIQGFEEARKGFGQFHKYRGVTDCFISIYRKEGLLAFYKGASPSIIKASLGVSTSFTTYELVSKYLKQLRT